MLSQDPTVCLAIPLPPPKKREAIVVAHQAGTHYRCNDSSRPECDLMPHSFRGAP